MTASRKAKYRHSLPQLGRQVFLSDGGLETSLIFHEGWELPHFASFILIEDDRGRTALGAYTDRYIALAVENGYGFILETPTWRSNPDWGAKVGYDRERLAAVNLAAVDLMVETRDRCETTGSPIVISGNIGPKGDGYDPGKSVTADEFEAYHAWQIGLFASSAADLVSAFTMTTSDEALGVARAAKTAAMPCVISFTLETDGRLPSGEALSEAIAVVDDATEGWPAYYMINCAHPTHFDHVLKPGAPWMARIRGLRANSSCRSHAELDNAPDLDIGNPEELGRQYRELRRRFPQLTVLGGCCGTDHRHVTCIGEACKAAA